MIFDMTRRSSGGGSGPSASDAILTVTVPTGSTVTMTKGGVTLTPTMWVQAADNTLDFALFVIAPSLFDAVNAWTVTATLGTASASKTIIISASAEYDVQIDYYAPAEYQGVEYLESTTTQYINTGIKVTENYVHIVADFYDVDNGTRNWGSMNNSSPYNFTGFPYISSTGQEQLYIGTDTPNAPFGKNTRHELDLVADNGNYSLTIDGATTTGTYGGTVANNYNVFLFTCNVAGILSGITKQRHQKFKVMDSTGTALVDLRAVSRKSDSVLGYWDAVSRTMLTNAGTGSFIAGPNI